MSTYSDLILSHGATAYWPLDDGVGSATVRDMAGSRTGTVGSGVTLGVAGVVSGMRAMDVNGVSPAGVTLASVPALGPVFSHEAWIRIRTPVTNMAWLSRRSDAKFNEQSNFAPNWVLNIPGVVNALGIPITVGVWYHHVVTYDGTTSRGYVNGVFTAPTHTFAIGVDTGAGAGLLGCADDFGTLVSWDGQIQSVACYPLVLTPTQITQHYTVGTTPVLTDVGDLNTEIAVYLGYTSGSDLTTLVSGWVTAHATGDATADVQRLIDLAS